MFLKMCKRSLILIFVCGLLFSFSACGKIPKEDLISVYFENFDGYGHIEVYTSNPNSETITQKQIEEFAFKYVPDLAFEEYGSSKSFYFDDIINFVPEEDYSRLSNGDTVYVVAKVTSLFEEKGVTIDTVKKEFGINFDERVSYTVEGLTQSSGGKPVYLADALKEYVKFYDDWDEMYPGYTLVRLELPRYKSQGHKEIYKAEGYYFYTEAEEEWGSKENEICVSSNLIGFSDKEITYSLDIKEGIDGTFTDYHGRVFAKSGTKLTYKLRTFDLAELGVFLADSQFTVVVP